MSRNVTVFFSSQTYVTLSASIKTLLYTEQHSAALSPMIFSRCTLLFQTDVAARRENIESRQCLLDLTCLQLSDRLRIAGVLIMISGAGFAFAIK